MLSIGTLSNIPVLADGSHQAASELLARTRDAILASTALTRYRTEPVSLTYGGPSPATTMRASHPAYSFGGAGLDAASCTTRTACERCLRLAPRRGRTKAPEADPRVPAVPGS